MRRVHQGLARRAQHPARQIACRALPVTLAEVGPRRRRRRCCCTDTSTSCPGAPSSSSPGRRGPAAGQGCLRHEGRPRLPAAGDSRPARAGRRPGAARHRAGRGIRGGGRAGRRAAGRPRASSATSRSPASRPTCMSASPPRASSRCACASTVGLPTARPPGSAKTRSCGRWTCSARFIATVCDRRARSSSTGRRSTSADPRRGRPRQSARHLLHRRGRRHLPEQDPDAILDEVRGIPGATVVSTFKRPPAQVDPELPFVRALCDATAPYTNGRR